MAAKVAGWALLTVKTETFYPTPVTIDSRTCSSKEEENGSVGGGMLLKHTCFSPLSESQR
jgi:hypothetical protein